MERRGEQRWLRYSVALVIAPPALWLLFIRLFGVDVVVLDSWDFVPLIEKSYEGTVVFADLFEPHNVHRIFFPRIIMLALARLTQYNKFAEMYFLWALVTMSSIIIYTMYRRSAEKSVWALLGFAPVVWLLFSFRQYESILSGFQIQTYLCALSFICCVYLIEDGRRSALLGSVCCGIISTFSFFNGLLVWPIGAVLLFFGPTEQRVWRIVMWVAVGTAVWIAYFAGWAEPSRGLSDLFSLRNLLAAPVFFVMCMGSPLAFVKSAAGGMGAILCVFMLAVLVISVRNGFRENVKWAAFILFAMGSSLFFTIGRMQLGPDAALASRYVCFTVLGVVACYMTTLNMYEAAKNNDQKRRYAMLLGGITSIILVGLISGYSSGVLRGGEMRDERSNIASILLDYNNITGKSVATQPFEIEIIKERAEILEKRGLSIFREDSEKRQEP